MAVRNAVLVFSCSPEDIGWEEPVVTMPGLQPEVVALHNAIVGDIVERFSEQPQYRVILFETSDSQIETSLPAKVERRLQSPGLLHRRLCDGVREVLEGGDVSSAIIFLGRNPLYPLPLLAKGIELLAQEDDVVVLGEALQEINNPALSWLSLKTYHAELFEGNERWWQGGTPLLQAAADVQALVMTVRPVRNIASIEDLGYLFHEIEREVLLKQWYPVRTYEALWRMRKKHLIPESTG